MLNRRVAGGLAVLALALCGPVSAAPVVTLVPGGGAAQGPPGGLTGWGFEVTPDAVYWTTFTGVIAFNETNPALGLFLDLLGPQGGPSGGVLAPGAAVWTEPSAPFLGLGLGLYVIDGAAVAGAGNSGEFLILYERYSGDPASCGGCFVDSGFASVPFMVQVVPEPATGGLLALGLYAMCSISQRRAKVQRR